MGTLLEATAYNGDNGLFSLAFCVYDIENDNNWNWIIRGLRQMLYEVPDPYAPPHHLVFISDTDKGLTTTLERYFPDAVHSHCVLHLMKNFKNKFKKKTLI